MVELAVPGVQAVQGKDHSHGQGGGTHDWIQGLQLAGGGGGQQVGGDAAPA